MEYISGYKIKESRNVGRVIHVIKFSLDHNNVLYVNKKKTGPRKNL